MAELSIELKAALSARGYNHVIRDLYWNWFVYCADYYSNKSTMRRGIGQFGYFKNCQVGGVGGFYV